MGMSTPHEVVVSPHGGGGGGGSGGLDLNRSDQCFNLHDRTQTEYTSHHVILSHTIQASSL